MNSALLQKSTTTCSFVKIGILRLISHQLHDRRANNKFRYLCEVRQPNILTPAKLLFTWKCLLLFFFFQRVVGEGGLPPQPLPLRGPWICPTEKKIQPCICYWCLYSVVYLNTHGKGLSWTKNKNEIKMNHNLYTCCFLNNYLFFPFLLHRRKLTRFELRKECLKRRKKNFRESWQILRLLLQIINVKDCRWSATSPNL